MAKKTPQLTSMWDLGNINDVIFFFNYKVKSLGLSVVYDSSIKGHSLETGYFIGPKDLKANHAIELRILYEDILRRFDENVVRDLPSIDSVPNVRDGLFGIVEREYEAGEVKTYGRFSLSGLDDDSEGFSVWFENDKIFSFDSDLHKSNAQDAISEANCRKLGIVKYDDVNFAISAAFDIYYSGRDK
ncbi:hypothetical protein CMI42_01345 [Candidatus Pacearchaeota archaeon]|nr:hypothetical protein [Candidatus Pacearchaeota archaeon]|tara:strand:- start:11 stop:571 length:561 start_codon:yes stop_codon:yes gene_type:complete